MDKSEFVLKIRNLYENSALRVVYIFPIAKGLFPEVIKGEIDYTLTVEEVTRMLSCVINRDERKKLVKVLLEFKTFNNCADIKAYMGSSSFKGHLKKPQHLPLVVGRYYRTNEEVIVKCKKTPEGYKEYEGGAVFCPRKGDKSPGMGCWYVPETGEYRNHGIGHARSIKEEVFFPELGKKLKLGRKYELNNGVIVECISKGFLDGNCKLEGEYNGKEDWFYYSSNGLYSVQDHNRSCIFHVKRLLPKDGK